jgi:L-2-hydroxyglutarate oxidase LhgO
MEQTNITIVGAGVVGLAIASRLSRTHKDIIVLEQHDGFGRETSSRNSEVIHAGFYYPSDSLKAKLCVEGNPLLYSLCAAHAIPHARTGKIVIGNTQDEIRKIHSLFEQGVKNGVRGLELLTKEQVLKKEPHVVAQEGLFSPSTGIVDSHLLMGYFEQSAMASGTTVGYNCRVTGLSRGKDGYIVRVLDADGQEMDLETDIVINAAGLYSDRICEMAGIAVDASGYRIHPCKGEYFSVSNRHRGRLSHLVYPAPTAVSLGVHAVLKLDKSLKLGPNAFYVDAIEDYDVDSSHRHEFFETARTYLPFLDEGDLSPDMSGIRPKLQTAKESFRDFVIREESDRGLPRFINLVGIESPGLTAACAIADHAGRMVESL